MVVSAELAPPEDCGGLLLQFCSLVYSELCPPVVLCGCPLLWFVLTSSSSESSWIRAHPE
jgi:hypothetical protein